MMKKKALVFTLSIPLILLTFLTFLLGETKNPSGVTLNFASPGPSPQDLAWDGAYLWNVDDDTDFIYMLNPINGQVLLSFPSPATRPRGLTHDGTFLWCSDDSTKMIYQLNPTNGEVLVTFNAPLLEHNGDPVPLGGLAWDGSYLWSSFIAGFSSSMCQIDPGDGSLIETYFTKGDPNALASDGIYIWNASNCGGLRQGLIYKYDLSNVQYVMDSETPGFYPSGLAYDGQDMWCADNETAYLFKLTINKGSRK